MAETQQQQQYSWPSKKDATVIGISHDRIDGLAKATGAAKYTYDVNLPNQLVVRALGCPHGHCRIRRVDTSAAERVPGVVDVYLFERAKPGTEIQYQGDLLVAVAAETEAAAVEGVGKIALDYEELPVFTSDEDLNAAEQAGRTQRVQDKVQTVVEPKENEDQDAFTEKELDRLFRESAHVVEGIYGIDSITHCCLEPHGATVMWEGKTLKAYLSTQNVSGCDEQFATPLGIAANDVEVICQYIGGGFGSKFAPDHWAIAAAEISRKTGRPVKFMLDRDQELQNGGSRPSGYAKVRLGADAEGAVHVWDAHHWGSNGFGGGGLGNRVFPYVYEPKNHRCLFTPIVINAANGRAWRAPSHPQTCALSQTAYDDLARKMGADSYDIFYKNLANIASQQSADVYREELKIAANLIDWKAKWHLHGKGPARGSIVEGLGIGIHTWGGGANASICRLVVRPDGSVEAFCGTQDLGTGTRTICAMVLAETFGLRVDQIGIQIGSSKYPNSGASGGSTTVGAVAESHRRAGQDALVQLFAKAAPKLEASPDELEAREGRVRVKGRPSASMSWKECCGLLGLQPLEVTAQYTRGAASPLSSSGVGGVQMAHVAVDRETGVVKMRKFVAVQDMGLVINPKTAISQINGALIMGIAYALYEQRLLDPSTGSFVNAELRDYKLPRLGDIGELVVEIYEPEDQRNRGVIGLGEPPVIAPGAAISNAVCNALGVRVPILPLTPKRVMDAIKNAAGRA